MRVEKKDNRIYFKSEILELENGVKHGFTAKCGGVSNGNVEGLNLGFRCGDDKEAVIKNYKLVAEDLGMPFERITAARQTHSVNIRTITEEDAGKGVFRESDINETDGLITKLSQIPLVVFYADCVPILLADSEAGVVAAVHSGWRGTVGKIAENAIKIMCEKFGAERERIKAAIGPSIGPCCFETNRDVSDFFEDCFKEPFGEKYKVNLWKACKKTLTDCGVLEKNIDVFGLCTVCRNDILYSYRSHKDKTGRMGAFIMLD